MPEIAEVRISHDLMKDVINNKTLSEVNLLSGRYTKKAPANYVEFMAHLPSKVKEMNTRGKFLYLILDNGWSIGITFGMSGRMMKADTTDEHDHHRIEFKVQEGKYPKNTVYYNDMRNFGTINFWPPKSKNLEKKLETLGPDLLQTTDLSKEEVAKLFRTKKYKDKDITKAIMSQEVLAGPGNWMRNEILFETRVNPYAKISSLDDETLYEIYKGLVKMSKNAYEFHKQNLTDEKPYKIIELIWNVYMQDEYQGHPVVRNTKDTRTTHWVPELQTKGKP